MNLVCAWPSEAQSAPLLKGAAGGHNLTPALLALELVYLGCPS